MSETMAAVAAAQEASVSPPPETETEAFEPTRAWLVGYGQMGIINIVAESQVELVARIGKLRQEAGYNLKSDGFNDLRAFEVLSNKPGEPAKSTVWLNPLLIEVVLDEFIPRPAEASGAGGLGLPPALAAMLEQAQARIVASGPEPETDGDVAEVVVAPAPVPEPKGD